MTGNAPITPVQVAEPIREKLVEDVRCWARIWQVKPGLGLVLRLLFLEPGYQLALSIRLQEMAGRIPLVGRILRRLIWFWATRKFGSDIDPGAQFGPGIYFPHPFGIVIGSDCRVGRDVGILQGVTLGRKGAAASGPTVGDRSMLNAGAVLVGGITIGAGCRVGANAVVLCDVPDYHVAVGVPARILPPKQERSGGRTGTPQ
jgi:serine O-acetyltransferase